MHPGILQIPNNETRVALYKLKRMYKENLQVFHEVRGVEQALIQQVVTAFNKQYIISTKNRTNENFTGNIRQIVTYLLPTYGKISPNHFNDSEKELTYVHYEPVTPVENIFNNIEDLLKYGDI